MPRPPDPVSRLAPLVAPLVMPRLGWLVAMGGAWILVHALGAVLGILGVVMLAAWWVMAFKLAAEVLEDAAAGRDADSAFEHFASDGVAFRQVMLGLGVIAIGATCLAIGGKQPFVLFCLVLTLVLPAIVVLLVKEDSLVHAFDPRAWFALVARLGGDYVAVALQIALLVAALWLVGATALVALPAWIGGALLHLLTLYLLLASYGALGALLYRHRAELGIEDVAYDIRSGPGAYTAVPVRVSTAPAAAGAAPTPSKAPAAPPSPEERAAVAEADRLVAANQPVAAAGVLDRLIRGRGATTDVHARYRALLGSLGDTEALQRHARDYVAVLLHLGDERAALSHYLAAREADPSFELVDPQSVSDLLAVAARRQQSQLAVALYEEFARRFPRDRDLVLNGLTAAKLMDRLGRDAEAVALLRDLQQRFPEHPLAAELEAALQAIVPGP